MNGQPDYHIGPSHARPIVALALVALAGCDWPRDSHGTLAEIRSGTLKIGILESSPWATADNAEPAGVEVELVKLLCTELGCRPQWFRGSPDQLLPALEHFELHLVIGSITRDTPWRDRIGLTRPFLTTELLVAVARDRPAIPSVYGHRIVAAPGSHTAGLIRRRGGIPVNPGEPDAASLPVAVEDWQLDKRNLKSCDLTLETFERVWAIPPGENGWLYRLDRFIETHRRDVRRLLEREAPP